MAFSDDMIRAIVATGQYSDAAAAEHLAQTLMKRRDAIGRAYLTGINPITNPLLDSGGVLTFRNAAVDAGAAKPPASYRARWFTFDNATGESRSAGAETSDPGGRLQAPRSVSTAPFIRIELSATGASPAWQRPVDVYFRRGDAGVWRLVGLDRLPGPQSTQP